MRPIAHDAIDKVIRGDVASRPNEPEHHEFAHRHKHGDRGERQQGVTAAALTASDDGLRNRALLEFLAATGCRVSELVALDREKIELDPHAVNPKDGVRIADEVTVCGKGSRYRRVFLRMRAREWLPRHPPDPPPPPASPTWGVQMPRRAESPMRYQ